MFRGSYFDTPPTIKFKEMISKYGPIFTIWTGPTPAIIVNNYELQHEASMVKRNHFNDRNPNAVICK